MSRHPLDDALRTSEEPPRAAFLAGVTRLLPDPLTSQNKNVDLDVQTAVAGDLSASRRRASARHYLVLS